VRKTIESWRGLVDSGILDAAHVEQAEIVLWSEWHLASHLQDATAGREQESEQLQSGSQGGPVTPQSRQWLAGGVALSSDDDPPVRPLKLKTETPPFRARSCLWKSRAVPFSTDLTDASYS
jgi:hypothetical protein